MPSQGFVPRSLRCGLGRGLGRNIRRTESDPLGADASALPPALRGRCGRGQSRAQRRRHAGRPSAGRSSGAAGPRGCGGRAHARVARGAQGAANRSSGGAHDGQPARLLAHAAPERALYAAAQPVQVRSARTTVTSAHPAIVSAQTVPWSLVTCASSTASPKRVRFSSCPRVYLGVTLHSASARATQRQSQHLLQRLCLPARSMLGIDVGS